MLRATGLARYPKDLRENLKKVVAELRTHNASWNDCGRLLGVSVSALHSWDKKPRKEAGTGLVRVNIAPDVKSPAELSTLTLRTPSGYELSGFSLIEAAHLVRALG